MGTVRINLVSNPRNLSTALMYAFAERSDTRVVDEPFYGHYLLTAGHAHPGREEIIGAMENDLDKIKSQLTQPGPDRDILFIKNMAKHLDSVDQSFWEPFRNVFYIRDPKQLISSFAEVVHLPTMEELGFALQLSLFQHLAANGNNPIVLDSGELLKDPAAVLQKLCAALRIPWDTSMLSWPAGPRPEDGVWAKYWYRGVHQSTHFAPRKTSTRPLPPRCTELYEQCQPYYEALFRHSITA